MCAVLNLQKCQDLLPEFRKLKDWLTPVNASIAKVQRYRSCDLDKRFNKPGLCNKTLEAVEVDDTGSKYTKTVHQEVMVRSIGLLFGSCTRSDFYHTLACACHNLILLQSGTGFCPKHVLQ